MNAVASHAMLHAHSVHIARRFDIAATQTSRNFTRHDPVTTSPFAAKSAAIPPYAGNGFERNFESLNP